MLWAVFAQDRWKFSASAAMVPSTLALVEGTEDYYVSRRACAVESCTDSGGTLEYDLVEDRRGINLFDKTSLESSSSQVETESYTTSL